MANRLGSASEARYIQAVEKQRWWTDEFGSKAPAPGRDGRVDVTNTINGRVQGVGGGGQFGSVFALKSLNKLRSITSGAEIARSHPETSANTRKQQKAAALARVERHHRLEL